MEKYKFQEGDKAYKPKGYKFPCTIVSVFKTIEGKIRIVAEMDEYGLLHIFNEDQLEHYEEQNNIEKVRELIVFDYDTIRDLWVGVRLKGSSVEINNETYVHVEEINTSYKSDGASWDYIVQRKSDKKYFKFNVWELDDYRCVYEFSHNNNSLTEVFQKGINKNIYE
jgi:hypothetical protein